MLKKVLVGMAVLSAVSMAQGTNVYLRAGADIWDKFDVLKSEGEKMTNEKSDDFSYEIALEATREIYPDFELGLGIAYQDHRSPKNKTVLGDEYKMSGYTSVPVYVTGKYNVPVEFHSIKPYIKMDLGYSFNDSNGNLEYTYGKKREISTKVDNGAYFGIGAGVEYNNFTTDIMYKITKSKVKVGSQEKDDYNNSRVTLSVGYKFNF